MDNLPNLITHLTFGENFNQNVDNLPTSITQLTFGDNFDKQSNFDQPIDILLIRMAFVNNFEVIKNYDHEKLGIAKYIITNNYICDESLFTLIKDNEDYDALEIYKKYSF